MMLGKHRQNITSQSSRGIVRLLFKPAFCPSNGLETLLKSLGTGGLAVTSFLSQALFKEHNMSITHACGSYRSPTESNGALRSPEEPHGALQSPSETYGALQSPPEPYRALWSPSEPHGTLQSPTELYGTPQHNPSITHACGSYGAFGALRSSTEPYGALHSPTEPYAYRALQPYRDLWSPTEPYTALQSPGELHRALQSIIGSYGTFGALRSPTALRALQSPMESYRALQSPTEPYGTRQSPTHAPKLVLQGASAFPAGATIFKRETSLISRKAA